MEKRRRLGGSTSAALETNAALERVQQEQDLLDEINDQAAMEILCIQRRANEKRAPVYESRRLAIARVPGFWKSTLMGHPWLADIITDQ